MISASDAVHGYITDPGGPSGLDLRELPAPVPAEGEVLVQVRAYAINRGELTLLSNRPDGWRPGQDLAGVVAAEAADGTGPPKGARVVGLAEGGSWSQLVAVATDRCAVLGDQISFEDAAALPVAGLTALRALRTGGSLIGRRVLITGASGGVGSFAVQLAALAGAHVTACVSTDKREGVVRTLGADSVVTEIGEQEGPFDHILDGVGGPVLGAAIHRLAPQGTVAAYGVSSGEATPLAFADFASGPLSRLIGFFIYATEALEPFARDLHALASLVDTGRLRVAQNTRYDWTDTREAIDAMRRREVTGKAVLSVT
jgi:NADPH:quinone reductase